MEGKACGIFTHAPSQCGLGAYLWPGASTACALGMASSGVFSPFWVHRVFNDVVMKPVS